MAIVNVSPTLPDSTLAPPQVLRKFHGAISGLSCGCSQIDTESGVCLDPDPCTTDTGTTDISTLLSTLPTTGDVSIDALLPNLWVTGPISTLASPDPALVLPVVGGTVTGYFDQSGDMLLRGSDGSWTSTSPSGVTTNVSASSLPPVANIAPSGSTSAAATPAQAAAANAVAANVAGGLMSIAKLLAVQPGTVMQANGAISRQTAGYPVNTIGTSLTTSSTSTLMMIGVFALGALFLMNQGRR